MKHIFKKGTNDKLPTLLLLHGTGGNEHDLISIAEMISPQASILSVRGNVLENGMPRFFRRLEEGVFDIEDLIFRTQELNDAISEFALQYHFDREQIVAIGYSNGANIAASLLYHHVKSLFGAILFHAMVPRQGVALPNLNNTPVFIGAGKQDSLIPLEQTKKLSSDLQQAGADITEFWTDGGHQLNREEVEKAKTWFTEYFDK